MMKCYGTSGMGQGSRSVGEEGPDAGGESLLLLLKELGTTVSERSWNKLSSTDSRSLGACAASCLLIRPCPRTLPQSAESACLGGGPGKSACPTAPQVIPKHPKV